MLDNQSKKDQEKVSNITYTREFQIKNSLLEKKKRSWKKIVIPFIIIAAVAIVTVVLLFTLKLVDVKIGD